MISEKDLFWIAGFWEGEGYAGIYKIGKTPSGKIRKRLEIGIVQKNQKSLLWINKVIGYGNVRKRKDGVSRWQQRDNKAKKFLRLIYPYLKFRKEQVFKLIS